MSKDTDTESSNEHADPTGDVADMEQRGPRVLHIKSKDDLLAAIKDMTGGKLPEAASGLSDLLNGLFGVRPTAFETLQAVQVTEITEEQKAKRTAGIRTAVEHLLENIDEVDGLILAYRSARPKTREVEGETQHGHEGIVEIGVLGSADVIEALIGCAIERFEESTDTAIRDALGEQYGTDDVDKIKAMVESGEAKCPGCGKYHGGVPVSQGGTIPDDEYEAPLADGVAH